MPTYNLIMQKRSSKTDLNLMAKSIVDDAINEDLPDETVKNGKNPAAVALGRLGGLKGGKARAASLSAERRKEIAKKAVKARWSKKDRIS